MAKRALCLYAKEIKERQESGLEKRGNDMKHIVRQVGIEPGSLRGVLPYMVST